MDVSLETVQARDPKGLYAKVAAGQLKGMTGMSADAPYEPPLHPEVTLPNDQLTIEASVAVLMKALKGAGALTGGPTHRLGLPLPYGSTKAGQFLEVRAPRRTCEPVGCIVWTALHCLVKEKKHWIYVYYI